MNLHPDLDTLSVYRDGELSPTESAAVQAHVRNCAQCTEILAAWQSQALLIERLMPEPQADLAERVLAALPGEVPAPRRLMASWLTAVAGSAAGLGLLALPLLLLSRAGVTFLRVMGGLFGAMARAGWDSAIGAGNGGQQAMLVGIGLGALAAAGGLTYLLDRKRTPGEVA